MDLDLAPEHVLLRDTIREFMTQEVAPVVDEHERARRFPSEAVARLGEMGWLGIPVPEPWGGAGMDTLAYAIAIEEIGRVWGSLGLIVAAHTSLGCGPLLLAGTDAQKERFLTPMASGRVLGGYGLTEPGAGSDAGGTRTTARHEDGPDGGTWVIDGGKRFITNAGVAGLYTVFAKTDPDAGHAGISAFLVEADAPGFAVARLEPKLGISGSTTGELTFDDCRVPAGNLLGEEGEGFKIAMRILDRSRPGVAAQALGIAQGATDYALEYAKTRETMGKPIAQHQLIQAKLADMETMCEAARGLLYRFGQMCDAGVDDAELTKASAMAKLLCGDVAMDVTVEAVQILGGYGYIKEYPVERFMRDAKITQIYEGTQEVQRLVIAREMLRESRAFLLAGV